MKTFILTIALLVAIKVAIHFAANANYGFHRDELLHLSVSEHPAWGYMEFPPFIAWIGNISHAIFGYSLFGTRVLPTLAGAVIVLLTMLIAREFGGKMRASVLAGVCVLCFLPFYRNHTLFQPVAFDQLFWLLGLYFLIRYFNTGGYRFLMLVGVNAGLGLLNKYTFLLWGAAVVVALAFHKKGKLFRDRWLYIAGAIAALIFLPNLLWQWNHNFPILLHQQKLQEIQLAELSPWKFGLDQLRFPFTLAVSLAGLWALFLDDRLKKYRSIGVFCLVVFGLMWATRSKSYYFYGTYPILFAAGAVKIEEWIRSRAWIHYALITILAASTIPFIPDLTPILPIDQFVAWKNKEPDAEGRIALTSDYADMFGWEEQVSLVDSLYQSLSPEDRSKCILWAENYGEAGAIKILGDRYGLPDPICAHGSFWLFGPGDKKGEICISLGNEIESVERVFHEYHLVKTIRHKYAIDEEHNIPLYLCRNPKINIQEVWPALEKSVFD